MRTFDLIAILIVMAAVFSWWGGISVALALSMPGPREPGGISGRNVILAMTYVVVVFSILVQGLTIGPLTRRWLSGTQGEPSGET